MFFKLAPPDTSRKSFFTAFMHIAYWAMTYIYRILEHRKNQLNYAFNIKRDRVFKMLQKNISGRSTEGNDAKLKEGCIDLYFMVH